MQDCGGRIEEGKICRVWRQEEESEDEKVGETSKKYILNRGQPPHGGSPNVVCQTPKTLVKKLKSHADDGTTL